MWHHHVTSEACDITINESSVWTHHSDHLCCVSTGTANDGDSTCSAKHHFTKLWKQSHYRVREEKSERSETLPPRGQTQQLARRKFLTSEEGSDSSSSMLSVSSQTWLCPWTHHVSYSLNRSVSYSGSLNVPCVLARVLKHNASYSGSLNTSFVLQSVFEHIGVLQRVLKRIMCLTALSQTHLCFAAGLWTHHVSYGFSNTFAFHNRSLNAPCVLQCASKHICVLIPSNSPRVTKKQNKLSTMVSMMASMSVSCRSALLMAAGQTEKDTHTTQPTAGVLSHPEVSEFLIHSELNKPISRPVKKRSHDSDRVWTSSATLVWDELLVLMTEDEHVVFQSDKVQILIIHLKHTHTWWQLDIIQKIQNNLTLIRLKTVTMVTLVTWVTALAANAALAMSSSLLLLMAEMKFR